MVQVRYLKTAAVNLSDQMIGTHALNTKNSAERRVNNDIRDFTQKLYFTTNVGKACK